MRCSAGEHLVDIEGVTGSIPVASTILPQHIASVEETAFGRSKTPVCYSGLLQQQCLNQPENGSETTTSDDAACYSNLLRKPSQRLPQPCSRPPHRRRPNPPGLIIRGRVFHVRVAVPRKVQPTVGRTEVWRSLGTGNRSEAIRKSKVVIADLERSFWAAGGISAADAPATEIATRQPVVVEAAPVPLMTFGDLFRHFHADPSKVRAPKTQMIYDGLLWITSSVWGENRSLTSIDRSACRELLEVLRWLPSNPVKRFPTLSAVQAAKMAKRQGLQTTLSPGSINGYMAKLRALLTFAANEGWIGKNPATGLNVIDPIRDKDKRLPFSSEQLRLIFEAPIYRGCVDDEWHFATPGPNRPRRARFWIPLIALYSGMRLNEICQLDVADVRRVDGVDCFWITGGSTQNAGDKRLKTASSERLIPIHPMLIAAGFMTFVSERSGGKKLFHELPRSKAGYYSDSFSKWFARFLEKAGAARPKTCFHSFRHCYRDALRNAGVGHEAALALGGWAASSRDGESVSDAYGKGLGIARLAEAISRLDYQNLDLEHLLPSPRGG